SSGGSWTQGRSRNYFGRGDIDMQSSSRKAEYPGDGVNFAAMPNSAAVHAIASVRSMKPCDGVNFAAMIVRHCPAIV
ncbi:MAG TPA: hypothetical protein DCG90_01135, partial [Sphingobium sp.]|uniref:hypothetical protein n=1 Tax=Sphingobium sp. TaxID=1912891 RepID=UPI000EBC192D